MGTGGAVYATCYSRLGLAGVGLTGPGTFLVFLLWRSVLELNYRAKNGRWLKSSGSRLLDEEGKYKWRNLIPLLGNVLINGLYLIIMSFAWNFAKLGGLNQGLVTTWLSVASVYNVITFYCVFGEKPLPLQYLGIVLIIVMIVCLDFAAYDQKDEEADAAQSPAESNGYSRFANSTFALLLGALSPILISAKALLIRWYHKLGYRGFDLAIDANIIQYAIYSIFMLHLMKTDHDYSLSWFDVAEGTLAGTMMGLATVLIAVAIAVGIAGPAQALMSTHALHQTLQTALFAG